MKKSITIVLLLLASFVKAQELKLSPYTQYLAENPFSISPTFAGYNEDYSRIRVSGAIQWLGIKGAPLTQNVSYDTRLNNEKSGIGVLLYNDRNGYSKQIGGQFSYAHHMILNQKNDQYLSLGISYRFNHFSQDVSEAHEGDYNLGHNDPYLGVGRSVANHNFEVGALYRIQRYFISVNASNILSKSPKLFDNDEPLKLRNYYVYTGYTILTRNEEYEFEPSIYFKYFESDGRSVSDANFKARKITNDGYFWAGLNFRMINDQSFKPLSIAPLLGIKKKEFYGGYSFLWDINESAPFNSSGTHMLTLGYDLEKGRSGRGWSR